MTIDTDPQFKEGYDEVHVDDKWFERTEVNQRCILIPGEIAPTELARTKNSLKKSCFCVHQLGLDSTRKQMNASSMEKLGFGHLWKKWLLAQRGSINRPRGTLETKSVIVTREVYLEMF